MKKIYILWDVQPIEEEVAFVKSGLFVAVDHGLLWQQRGMDMKKIT